MVGQSIKLSCMIKTKPWFTYIQIAGKY